MATRDPSRPTTAGSITANWIVGTIVIAESLSKPDADRVISTDSMDRSGSVDSYPPGIETDASGPTLLPWPASDMAPDDCLVVGRSTSGEGRAIGKGC